MTSRASSSRLKWILLAVLLAAVAAFAIWWLFLRSDIIYRGPPIRVGGGSVPERELVLMESEPGEDKIAFLKRVGTLLVEHSDRTGHEACGQVCQNWDSTQYAVQVVTNDAHIMCAMWTTCPTGYLPTGQNIHSHCPGPRRLRANLNDMALSANRIKRGSQLKPCDPNRFSDQDFAAGPGFLATPERLLFQSGRDTVEDMGALHSSAVAAGIAAGAAHAQESE